MIPARIIRTLVLITGLLAICHMANYLLGNPIWQLERLFDLGRDDNLPTWFSSILWLACAVAAYRCYGLASTPFERKIWLGLSLGLLVFSIDEVAKMHENFSSFASKHLLSPELRHVFHSTTWPIIAAPLIVAVFIWLATCFRKAVQRSPRVWRGVFFGFSLVVLGGAVLEMTMNFLRGEELRWLFQIEIVTEESLEMLGAIWILAAILEHLRQAPASLIVRS